MTQKETRRSRSGGWKWALGSLGFLVLLAVAGWIILFRVNQFTLSIILEGEQTMELEYGRHYAEPGGAVLLQGTLFWKNGVALENAQLQVDSELDEATLGRYWIAYTADYHGWHAEARRRVSIVDTQCPVITLVEDPEGSVLPGQPYREPGYTAIDNYDGDITSRVVRTESLGRITYAVVDSSGNPDYVEREIPYYDPLPPEITLEGGGHVVVTVGSFYEEPGYTAIDNVDGDVTEAVIVEGEVDWLHPGVYPITYTVTDSYQNVATVTREVEVAAVPRPKVEKPKGKTIYLTFDDGPGPYTKALLDVLDKYDAKATFFVTDSGYDNAMKQIVDRGHSIGIHTVSHNYSEIYASPEAYFADLHRMQDIIYENTGVRTTLLRFPGGSSNKVSIKSCEGIMTLLTEAVQDAGFQYFDWNVDSNDAGGAKKAKTVFNNVIEGVSQNRISVVLQHDIHGFSVDAVEDILIWGRDHGYAFRGLTETSPGCHHGVNN